MVLPADPELWAVINGALLALTEPEKWEQVGSKTPEECAAFFLDWWLAWWESTTPCPP